MRFLVLISLVVMASTEIAQASKILVLSPVSSTSHMNFFMPVLKELGKRGHSVTVWSAQKPKAEYPNIRQLYSERVVDMLNRHYPKMEGSSQNQIFVLAQMFGMTLAICRLTYEDPDFLNFIQSSEKYDLIIVNALLNDCAIPLVSYLKAPFIYMNTGYPMPWIMEAVDSPLSFDHVPGIYSSSDEMNLLERVKNTVLGLYSLYFRNWVMLPFYESLARQALGRPNLPPIREIEKNLSYLITNTHYSVTYQYPKTSSIIEVGGLHCVPSKPLPQDLEDFVNGAGDDGFILMSFGSVLRGSELPEATRKVMISAFGRLKQRVLWKWEDDKGIKDLPPNVRLSSWLPQQDLLGHPKIKLFISHGGLLSNQEAVYHGVVLLGLPVFGDQPLNMKKAEKDGYAVQLDWSTLTEDLLYETIQRMISDSSFKEIASRMSRIMRDDIVQPLERAVHAVEYAIRYEGAPHLKTAARKLDFYQKGLLDVAFVLVITVLLLCYLNYRVWRFIFSKCCKSKNKSVKTE